MTDNFRLPPRDQQLLELDRGIADQAPRPPFPPASTKEWEFQRKTLRQKLLEAWGGFPEMAADFNVEVRGTLDRPLYKIEKLLIETFPGVKLTANAYVPKLEGKLPAVLCVHGHWRGAKQDPTVQSRCIGLAKLGFFVLVVDAFGAGERAIGKALGEYHGAMTGGSLLPTGRTLSGLQVAENMRCVDYLQSRPEVDPERIGVTGASGGGNQSMYVGAFDERIKAVVPVCSVGSYRVYVGVACCMCEVVPGGLQFTEESGILALTSPRALMVINATKDAVQFSVEQAEGSLKQARKVFEMDRVSEKLRHTVFESGHDYSQPMREAMYGWMTLHLKGEGDGNSIPEPEIVVEDPEELRCYPGESRPDDFVTLPRFTGREGKLALDEARRGRVEQIEQERQRFLKVILPTLPKWVALHQRLEPSPREGYLRMWFLSEPGLEVFADVRLNDAGNRDAPKPDSAQPWSVLFSLEGADGFHDPVIEALEKSGGNIAILNGRGTGIFSPKGNRIHNAADHNTAEWNLWVGRPALGGWAWDIVRLVAALQVFGSRKPSQFNLVGIESGAMPIAAAGVCLQAAGLRPIDSQGVLRSVSLIRGLGSYVTEIPFEKEYLGIMVPGILKKFGDVTDILRLFPEGKLAFCEARNAQGQTLSSDGFDSLIQETQESYRRANLSQQLLTNATFDLQEWMNFLDRSSE